MSDTPGGEVNRVMIDIETLGLEPGVAILSIGAVRFGPGRMGDTFEVNVDLTSCDKAGLTIDVSTLDWWLGQDEDAQHVLTGGKRLGEALFEFNRFYDGADEIWAFSPSFDCEILKAAYDAVDEAPPWTYRDERDARTVAALPIAPDVDHDGTEHDALDDAKHQAHMVAGALKRMQVEA